jgi:methoxymalonate biosynthesis protein
VIKCLIWDLDNTLFTGVYLEAPDQRPGADPGRSAVLAELAGRGILQAIASKNPPEAAQYASELTGHEFASVQCGWGAKSAAVSAVLDDLGLVPDEVAFVDDEAMERAQVAFALPDVLVLAPEDLADAAQWPQFSPPVVTAEARRRGELYAERRVRRDEAAAFGGSADEFLRYSGTQVRIALADLADLARLHELSVRTHQFNSTGVPVAAKTFAELFSSAGHQVITVRLSDKFGDDGLVGGCVIGTADRSWRVQLLMMSCRALGRGVIGGLLAWLCLAARQAGASQVVVACVINRRNVPLRIALTSAGFRADADLAADQPPWARADDQGRIAAYVIGLDQPRPDLPDWVTPA